MSNSNCHKYLQLERLGVTKKSENLKQTERLFCLLSTCHIKDVQVGQFESRREEGQVKGSQAVLEHIERQGANVTACNNDNVNFPNLE